MPPSSNTTLVTILHKHRAEKVIGNFHHSFVDMMAQEDTDVDVLLYILGVQTSLYRLVASRTLQATLSRTSEVTSPIDPTEIYNEEYKKALHILTDIVKN